MKSELRMQTEFDETEKPALGRPTKPVEHARTRRTVTFLTAGEYRQLADTARQKNLSISALAHQLIIQSLTDAP